MKKTISSHYDVLKVSRTAPDEVIRASYKVLSKKYHPDLNPDNPDSGRMMRMLNESYEILTDVVKRQEYDEWLENQENDDSAGSSNAAEKGGRVVNCDPMVGGKWGWWNVLFLFVCRKYYVFGALVLVGFLVYLSDIIDNARINEFNRGVQDTHRNISIIDNTPPANPAAPPEEEVFDYIIVPGERVGLMTKYTSEPELKRIYGRDNVVKKDVYVGEGMSEPGTIIFPHDKKKVLSVLWKDSSRKLISDIRIDSKFTKWRTSNGITIGTSLKEIEHINKRPVVMTGFGWDYSGTLIHGNGGDLKELGCMGNGIYGRTLLLRLDPDQSKEGSAAYGAVMGDGKFQSNNVNIQKLKPRVYEMIVSFN